MRSAEAASARSASVIASSAPTPQSAIRIWNSRL